MCSESQLVGGWPTLTSDNIVHVRAWHCDCWGRQCDQCFSLGTNFSCFCRWLNIITLRPAGTKCFPESQALHVVHLAQTVSTPLIPLLRRDWNFLAIDGGGGVWASVRPKKIKNCMMLNWNFQRSRGGMDNVWITHCESLHHDKNRHFWAMDFSWKSRMFLLLVPFHHPPLVGFTTQPF